ncbi:hypothetical protein NTJ12_002597 [Flavobacterium psychrophilum]|nr:hypothetical protein [Flavobacterium psychrophilum]
MEEKIKAFQEEFKKLKLESKEYSYVIADGSEKKGIEYYISGINGNPNLQLYFEEENEIEAISEVLRHQIFIFNDFLAIKYDNTIEVLLTTISFRTSLRKYRPEEGEENFKLFEIGLNYHKNELNISLEIGEQNNILPKLTNFIRGSFRYTRNPIILRIENYSKPSSEGIENDARSIINSVLFDIEFNYDIALETINIEGLLRRISRRKRKINELPKEKINLVFKKYIPELIQYFHIAEKVDFIPFKFICYYHILEYFSDKSAYHLVSKEVKKILLKPDFHLKTDHYVTSAINLFKKENDKYTGDKIKIERVLKQYLNRDDIKETLNEIELLDHFSKELILDCNKPLKLPAINFDSDGNFFSELTKRIYSVRCSIVHSNPDFDESKAVPFNPTPQNIEKLKIETELIMEIARKIIVESKE